MKKFLLVLVSVLIIAITHSSVVFAAGINTQIQKADKSKVTQKQAVKDEIKVTLNNKTLKLKNQPYIKSGKVLVPFKEILESVDKGVKWEENQQVVYTKLSSSEIYIKIGVNYGYLNGYKTQLELAPELKGNIIYVPFSLIGDGLGAEINWDSKSKTLNIKYVNTVYKLGEAGTYNKTKLSIDSVDLKTFGELKVIGKVSSKDENIVIEVSDDNGYILTQTMKVGEKTGDLYNMSSSLSLPTCHNFEAKRITLKIMNKYKKLVKIGEYII